MDIDFKVYNLVYYRLSDGRKFYVRRASSTDYILIDSNTFEKIKRTQYILRREFESDEAVARRAKRETFSVRSCLKDSISA